MDAPKIDEKPAFSLSDSAVGEVSSGLSGLSAVGWPLGWLVDVTGNVVGGGGATAATGGAGLDGGGAGLAGGGPGLAGGGLEGGGAGLSGFCAGGAGLEGGGPGLGGGGPGLGGGAAGLDGGGFIGGSSSSIFVIVISEKLMYVIIYKNQF